MDTSLRVVWYKKLDVAFPVLVRSTVMFIISDIKMHESGQELLKELK